MEQEETKIIITNALGDELMNEVRLMTPEEQQELITVIYDHIGGSPAGNR